MRLFLLLLPWLELFTLIKLGTATSALAAMAYVVVTLMLGLALLRRQGQGVFLKLREAQQGRVLGPQLLVDEMSLALVGLLLMFPGMITDGVALLVLIGPLRRRVSRWVMGPQPEVYAAERDESSRVTIEGDFRRMD